MKIKKYNESVENWREYSSTHANGIYTEVPELLRDEENIISVETGLERLSSDIKTLKGNVAWLAKNGGGGSGGGGTSGSSEASAKILVNGQETGETVILSDQGLNITVQTKGTLSKAWNVIISIGVQRIYTGSVSISNPSIILTKNNISRYLINYKGSLNISASYIDDLNGVYGSSTWNGNVIESSVYLDSKENSTSLQNINSSYITIDYSVGFLGNISQPNYQLIIKTSKDNTLLNTYSEDLLIGDNSKRSKLIYISSLIPQEYLEIGIYNFEISLKNLDDSSIYKTVYTNFTISSLNAIFISSNSLSEDLESPTECAINGSLSILFIAYLLSYSIFNYSIKINDSEVIKEGVGEFGKQTQLLLSLVEKSWAIENSIVKVTLTVNGGDLIAYKDYYIKIVSSTLSYLLTPNRNNLMYQFRADTRSNGDYDLSYNNPNFVYGDSNYSLDVVAERIKPNNLSVVNRTNSGTPYLRISNGSGYVIKNWNFSNNSFKFKDFFPQESINNFTISLCFKADYHADDFRTILFCGTIDNTTQKISTGISIDVHDVYINNKSVYKLTDNVVNMVDITCEYLLEETTDTELNIVYSIYYIIKVYIDGVVTFIEKINKSDFINLGNEIFLGCQYHSLDGEDIYTLFTDCNIYNLQIYNTVLTPYELMINRANNLAATNYINDQPNYALIDAELLYNFCGRDVTESDGIKSYLYNKTTNDYSINFLFENLKLDLDKLRTALNIGIPIMYLDVSSNSDWTFDNFVLLQSKGNISLSAVENIPILYWDPGKTNQSILTIHNCLVELQGTSTLEDAVKNLNITFLDSTVFIPKDTWLPEKTYTLKADVVDSSHSNNAAIGTFINDVLGEEYLPIDEQAKSNIENSNYVRNQLPTATLKHTVEGFPIFLIVNFHVETVDLIGITPLGIYSFNLGRNAIHNLGFNRINTITQNGQLIQIDLFPFLAEDVQINTENEIANWIETKDTNSVGDLAKIDGTSTSFPLNFDSHRGDFWLNDDNILDNIFEVRFPDDKRPSQYSNFKEFVLYIMKLPIESVSITDIRGRVLRLDISGGYDKYTCNLEGTSYEKTGYLLTISSDPNDFGNVPFNLESYRKYFVIAMLLGLTDNFGKNMVHKSWGNNGQYYAGFYDLDTALGGSNQGELNISYTLWLKYLYNKPSTDLDLSYAAETYDKDISNENTIVSASGNKLWLSLDTALNRRVQGSLVSSLYTESWLDLRNKLDTIAQNNSYNSFVDYFMDKFYINQTKNCGSLLFNYDYKLKYFLLFKGNSYKETKDLSKLHGRKIAYTRNWLEKRILFLDSLFYWRDTSQILLFKNDLNNRGANTVKVTPKVFPLMFNNSLLVYNSIGNLVTSYYFAKENEELLVDAGNNSSNSILTWNISNSSNLIKFGNDNIKLKDLNVVILSNLVNNNNINYIGYPSITVLDLSETKTLGNFSLSSFTPTGSGDYKRNPISEIRILDFSNTSGDLQLFILNLTEDIISGSQTETITRFLKLLEINIEGSTCISDLIIPNIPLLKLNVRGSSIKTFILKNQAYLLEVDLTNCTRLQKVEVNNCSGYKNFSISNLSNLTECKIINCSEIENITITNCGTLSSINIEGCPELKTITINNCKALRDDSLVINLCGKLNSINLKDCSNLTRFVITASNVNNIKTLNLQNTKVQTIAEGLIENLNLLDLRNFESLENFNISSNESIVEIQFSNILGSPIKLTNRFNSCSNLERIYGNVSINTSNMFNGLSKFSILGRNFSQYNGQNIKLNGITRLPSELANDDYFQTGMNVTNINIGTSNLSECFRGTDCTLFDIYYLLEKAGSTVTNISNIFCQIKHDPFSWTDSPHRNMFKKNTSLTTLSSAFYGSGNNSIKLYSPTIVNGQLNDDGLFSPLFSQGTLKTVSLSSIFYGRALYSDRHLFRHSNSDSMLNCGGFSYFNLKLIVDDINTFSETASNSITKEYVSENYQNLGNLTDFFKQLDASSFFAFADSMYYANYNTLGDIPGASFIKSFNFSFGNGILNMQDLFRNKSSVRSIASSFIVSYKLQISIDNTLQVNFEINDNTLNGFTSLINLGYVDGLYIDSGYGINSYTSSAFSGSGYNKYINSMPYNLLNDCIGIKQFAGFFRECNCDNDSPIELPGTLFYHSTLLESCTGAFSNVNFYYKLSLNGFANCPNLKNVSYLFAATSSYSTPTVSISASSDERKSYSTGIIPSKLFFHGKTLDTSKQRTIRGILGEITELDLGDYILYTIHPGEADETWCKINKSDGIILWENGEPTWGTGIFLEEQISFECYKYNTNIENMEGCFYQCNFDEYINQDPEIEYNPDYMPFDWEFVGDGWKKVLKDTYMLTVLWEYDGNTDISQYIKNLDNVDYNAYMYNIGLGQNGGSKNYICSPDLLRYCKTNCNITKLFLNCGHNSQSTYYGNAFSGRFDYGLKGRIVPYLLLPLKNSTNISLNYMFNNCKIISGYLKNSRFYIIPENFFEYCPNIESLAYAFSGMVFNYNVNLDVFNNKISPSKLKDISYIFFRTYYHGTSSSNRANISGIFTSFKQLTNIRYTFANSNSIDGSDVRLTDIYITFNGVFPSGVYSKSSYETNQNFGRAFAYFNGSSRVTYENKTLKDNDTTQNYTYHI